MLFRRQWRLKSNKKSHFAMQNGLPSGKNAYFCLIPPYKGSISGLKALYGALIRWNEVKSRKIASRFSRFYEKLNVNKFLESRLYDDFCCRKNRPKVDFPRIYLRLIFRYFQKVTLAGHFLKIGAFIDSVGLRPTGR